MKNKVVLSALLVLLFVCVLTLSSCAIEPSNVGKLYIESYTKNGVEYSYSSLINYYDFFDSFHPDNVTIIFNEDKTCCLTLFGVEYNGSYVSSSNNRETNFTITFDDESTATGTIFRGAFDGVWIDCTINYNGETYEFSDDGEDDSSNFDEQKAQQLKKEASSIENSLVYADGIYQRVEKGEYVYYTRGEVIKKNNTYYFVISEETSYEIRINDGFFYDYFLYDYEKETIIASTIKEGPCVYKGDFENGYFAVFYAELEQEE